MKPLSTLRKWYLLVVAGAVAVVMLAFMFSGTLAEETNGPAPDVLWQDGSCEPYTVVVDVANVRACAQTTCEVVEQLERGTSLCVLGEEAGAPGWLRVDLDTANAASPIYFISSQVVASVALEGAGAGGYDTCQSWLVTSEIAGVYACNEPGCSILGTLATDEWLCGNYYATIPNWIYAVDSDSGLSGWVVREDVTPGRTNNGTTIPFVATEVPSLSVESTGSSSSNETLAPTVTPADGPLTLAGRLPACQQYFVAAQTAPVRACAGAGCALVDTLEQGEGVCVRGVTANPEWLMVSLASDDPDNTPLYAIEKINIIPGLPPDNLVEALFAECDEFAAVDTIDNVNYRQCPGENCPVMGTLAPDDWVCVLDYGGPYEDWMRVNVPSGVMGVWVMADYMRDLVGEEQPEVALANAQLTPNPTTSPTPLPAEATPTRTPTLAPTDAASAASTSACIPYIVNVIGATGANVRTCSSVACDIVETYPQGTVLCVLGADPEDTNWLIVEQSPDDDTQNLVYVNSGVVSPQDAPTSAVNVTPQTAVPVVLPTATPQATLPVCEPGSALAECVTMTPTPVLTAIPANVPTGPLLAQEVKLSDLGVENIKLVSPAAAVPFQLYIPDDWVPDGNNVLYLTIEYSETRSQTQAVEVGDQRLVTLFDVTIDDDLIATVSLDETTVGAQTLAIPLPLDRLQEQYRDHTIMLEMRAEDHCLANSESQVYVRADQSYFHLEFRQSIPTLDLSLYPRPLYNSRFVSQSEIAYVVLPEDPTKEEMQVALSLGAGLGALTYNELGIRVLTADLVDETIVSAHNLILVGEVGRNALIDQYYANNLFPSVLGADDTLSVAGNAVPATDGVVQIISNPLNEQLAIVAVTGQSHEALVKASTALAGPPSVMGIGGKVTVITEVRDVPRLPVGYTLESQVTFAQLGYPLITLGGYGTTSQQISFYLPAGYQLTDEAYLDLEFNFPGILNTSRASIAVTMNRNYPIASAYLQSLTTPITQGTGEEITVVEGGPYHLRARIPADAVYPGDQNQMTITVNVTGDWECYPPDIQVAWLTVSGNSILNLPRARVAPNEITPVIGSFPVPYNTQPDLRDVWISLPDEPTLTEMEYAVRVSAFLGSSTQSGEGFTPRLSLGNDIPEGTDLSAYNVIVLGRHTTNSFLASLNASLPQPFYEGTDTLMQVVDDVVYQLPSDYEIGLLEIMVSPWSEDRVLLVISGTGAAGEANAVTALTGDLYGRSQLLGDVAYVSAVDVSTVDTRILRDEAELADEIEAMLVDLNLQATEAAQATQAAQVLATATTLTPTPAATQELAVTVTPIPQVLVTQPVIVTATSLFTPTIEPTVPTAIPTFEPLPPESLAEKKSEQPKWFEGALVAAGILLLATLIFGLLRMMRQDRRR